MNWLWLESAWLIPALPAGLVILWLGARRGRTALGALAHPARHRELLGATHRGRRRAAGLLRLLALACGTLAALGPALGETLRPVRHRGVDLLFLLDVSRSMLAGDLPPSRLERARRDILGLLDRLSGERLGLVAFSGAPVLVCPLTHDYGAFSDLLQRADPRLPALGGTDLGAGLERGLDALGTGFESHQALLVLSDGEDLGGAWEKALERARARNVRIYALGYGSPEGAKITLREEGRESFLRDAEGNEVVTRLDQGLLAALAEKSGGAYLRADSHPLPLEEILEKRVRVLEKREYEEERRRVPWNRYQWPLSLAVAALFVALALPERRGSER